MVSKFFFSLDSYIPQKSNEAGSITYVTAKEVPGFVNIAFTNLVLKTNGALEPIWHTNANKIGYCVKGSVIVTIRTPVKAEIFTVSKGDIFFIPEGYVHHIENTNDSESVINFVLNHSYPETMYLSKAVLSLSENVFNSTFDTPAGFVSPLQKAQNHLIIKTTSQNTNTSSDKKNSYKFDIEESNKAVLTKGGYLQNGTKVNLPVLHGLGILGFGLNPKGIVEPHWHTNAGELVYIVKGTTRITVLSPDGNVEVMEVKAGEGAFAPASHFHNIENIGVDEVKVIAFFTHAEPDYIGIGEVMGSYSNELLASIFNTKPDYFDTLQKPDKPLVIVPI